MVMLHNVCEHCVQILEEEKHRQLRMFVVKKVKETGIFIDKPKVVHPPENTAAVAESVCEGP